LNSDQGEFQEHLGHSGPVTKLTISYDDQYLFSASEDGTIYTFRISDKDSRGRREKENIYADEVKELLAYLIEIDFGD
jgi:WD40 repeat protein